MHVRKCAASVAIFVSTTASSFAADLPSMKAPPAYVPLPVFSWTGVYAGVNAGGTWGESHVARFGAAGLVDDPLWFPAAPFAASATGAVSTNTGGGFIGGGQIGYNFQFGSSFLVGVEADIQGVAGGGGQAQAFGAVFNPFTGSAAATATRINSRLDYVGTARGRLGWLFTPTLLLYGTGGFAYGGTSLTISQVSYDDFGFFGTGFGAGSTSTTSTGWTAGGGLEWMFMPNWSAKAEYLYYDIGTISANVGPVSGLNFTVFAVPGSVGYANVTNGSSRVTGHIVRAGVNYHFNWGGSAPILAKY